MTDHQAQIIQALHQSNTALTQAEIATQTGLNAETVRRELYALGVAGETDYKSGWYRLRRRKSGFSRPDHQRRQDRTQRVN